MFVDQVKIFVKGGDGGDGMVRLTYQIPGEPEPRVAVFLREFSIEGPESEVARLGFPPTPHSAEVDSTDPD